MNFGFSGEMIFLFLLALILFGPKKLPEIGRQIGRIMNEFRRASNEFRSQIESEINTLETDKKPQILPPLQAPLGSLASRIFNPPSADNTSPADRPKMVETTSAQSPAETKSAPATADATAVETGLAPSPVRPKVAPDA
ncbi:MAG: twin-arginine translocase TatA/TatE family subunit [Terriglobales bacterium]|jgi:sec-independent protein translocase protein TatB